jgi:energy-coupling factor transport system ATP-binding protein
VVVAARLLAPERPASEGLVARVESIGFAYPGAAGPALAGVSLELREGERVALLGPSGSGKTTLLRALAGLVPHFHGGRFSGRVTVAGKDTRKARPAELAGTVATVFQDPEDQVVMGRVENEVAFGLENLGVPPGQIWARVEEALGAVGIAHLAGRRTTELSGGELQRVCLASALALRPRLFLLDEPTSQLDPAGAEAFLDGAAGLGAAVVLSEQRTARALARSERALFLDCGRLLFDGPRDAALEWLAANRPAYVPRGAAAELPGPVPDGQPALALAGVSFAHGGGPSVLDGASLEVRRGEVVALEGPNGSGKTTLARIAAGLVRPDGGTVAARGRVAYLSQDPGRYLACERVVDEVALAAGGDREAARAALARAGLDWAAERHPRDLSSGERERLALAAVAAGDPDVLVLDEPTRGVDPERKAAIVEWLAGLAAGGRAVLVATHDAAIGAHRRLALRGGRVEAA